MRRILKTKEKITPFDIIENNIRYIKDGQVIGMSDILEEYKNCNGRTSFTNEQFQKLKIQEICDIWNLSTESKIIQCDVLGGKNIKFIDKFGETIKCHNLHGYYTFVVTHQPTKICIEFDMIITTPGECFEPRKYQKKRQYICFVENKKAFLSDDDTSGFYARIKTFLKKEGLTL